MAKTAILSIDIVSDASKAAAGFDAAGSAATGLSTDLGKVEAAAGEADRKMRLTAEGADNLDSKSAQATGSLGALSSGFELVGAEKYAMGLQSAALATDFMAGVGEGLNLILELQWVQTVKNTLAKIKDAIVTKTVAAATRVWTVAQIALNAVMSGNPIALVVLAIVALIAVIVVAYKKSDTFRRIVNNAFDNVRRVVVGTVGAVVDFVKSHWPLLLAILTGPFGLAFLAIKKFGPNIVSTVFAGLDKLRDVVTNQLGRVVDYFRELPGRIVKAVGNLGKLLYNAGADIIDGLLDGITSKFDDVKNKLGDLTGKMTDWKGPPGKDRVLLKPAGALIMDGLIDGIEARRDALRRKLGDVSTQIRGGITAGGVSTSLGSSTVNGVPVAGAGTTIIIQGAIDPASTARQVSDLLRRQENWLGRIHS